jgi:glutathione S-transferase
MMLRLYVTDYSPWSEMARWSLDIQGIPYATSPTVPVVGAPGMRLRTRRFIGPVVAPLAVKGSESYEGPWAIAKFGACRSLKPIIPLDAPSVVERWYERADRMLQAGRVLTLDRVRGNDDALREYLPRPAARLRRVGPALGRSGAALLLRRAPLRSEDARGALRADLLRLRTGLAQGDGGFLVDGRLTFADLAMGCALQFVEPVSERWVRLGEANRPLWRDAELADEFTDLVQWRDGLYEGWRQSSLKSTVRPAESRPQA